MASTSPRGRREVHSWSSGITHSIYQHAFSAAIWCKSVIVVQAMKTNSTPSAHGSGQNQHMHIQTAIAQIVKCRSNPWATDRVTKTCDTRSIRAHRSRDSTREECARPCTTNPGRSRAYRVGHRLLVDSCCAACTTAQVLHDPGARRKRWLSPYKKSKCRRNSYSSVLLVNRVCFVVEIFHGWSVLCRSSAALSSEKLGLWFLRFSASGLSPRF